ncbi:MAG: hypothetical protein ABIN89_23195 [Chitinophagaceae bacterium]
MKTYKIALGIAATLVIGFLVYQLRKNSFEKKLINISDAGYETAFDVLYPPKTHRCKRI